MTASHHSAESRRSLFFLYAAIAIVFAVLLAYAETRAFSFDEGFHLMAARLIKEGKRPYLDFCFPQTPLNAYLNAGWMSIFGAKRRYTRRRWRRCAVTER